MIMTNVYLALFYEFFKTGLFAIGGGYATIPFLFHMKDIYHWFFIDDLTNMIAVSNITPGPVGINMATYTGYIAKGFTGSLISTSAIVLGPFVITLLTIYFVDKFRESKFIKELFDNLKPVACALLSVVMIKLISKNLFEDAFFDYKAVAITIILFILYKYTKKFPSLLILYGAILGIVFNIF